MVVQLRDHLRNNGSLAGKVRLKSNKYCSNYKDVEKREIIEHVIFQQNISEAPLTKIAKCTQ